MRLAAAAAGLIGTRFRLHGRDPASGLDCIGLVHASLMQIDRESRPPAGYRLRNSDPARWFAYALDSGFRETFDSPLPGDILLIEPGPGQQHLLIVENHFAAIHAHAGLGRVVRQSFIFPRSPLAHWRLG